MSIALRNTLAMLTAAALLAAGAGADPECPVVSAGGTNTDDGSVLVVGQFAAGLVSNGADEVDQGAVPCWFPGGIDCFGDLDGDGVIGLNDLAQLLANYGEPSGMTYEDGDLDGDGDVDLNDLASMLSVYGNPCP